MFVLDSDIATLLFYGRNDPVRLAYDRAYATDIIRITLVSWVELLRGRMEAIRKAANGTEWLTAQERLHRLRDWLNGFEIASITLDAAQRFDLFLNQKKLQRFGRPDLLIACIALAHDATLVTRNVKDFAKIPNLKIENWAK